MTYERKKNFVERLIRWLVDKKHCYVSAKEDAQSGLTVYEVTETDNHGDPVNTICYEVVDSQKPDSDGWIEVFERKCRKKLLLDSFDLLGLGEASTLEELELKFEIISA